MEKKYKTIEGLKIHYRTHGNGKSALLLIHGAVGSTNDFAYQMHKNNNQGDGSLSEFVVVSYDLPGFGLSEIPIDMKTDPSYEFFEFCAKIGTKLMFELGYKTYSVGGWNDGARIASLLAIKYQSRADALILWSFAPVMDEQICDAFTKTRNTQGWNPEALELYESVYGRQKFSIMWRNYVDYLVNALELPDRFDIRDELRQIKCPTLVLYGSEDPLVRFDDHVEPIDMQIYDSSVMEFTGVSHNIHQAASDQFNKAVSRFVMSVKA